MTKLLKIGIVGCGAIGTSLAKIIVKDFSRQANLVALYDIDASKCIRLSRTVSLGQQLAARNLGQLIDKSELVIEAASALSSWEIAQRVLSRGRDIMIMSVGGIVNHFRQLRALATRYNAKVYIPTGAICGIDALKAAAQARIRKVVLTTYKNPNSFRGVAYIKKMAIDLNKIKKDTVLFSGSAEEAVKFFPQNINVAATLSIAGIGPKDTVVRIVASPKITKNIHEIQIESDAGRIITRTENVIHPDNPKTSYLAVLSAIAVLKQILEPVRVGT